MPSPTDDILTPRLTLRLMGRETVEACLAGDHARAEGLLGAAIPGELRGNLTTLEWARTELDTDPAYAPWSARAMLSSATGAMVGVIRFHTRPDPDYLHPFVRDAVEFGYTVFAAHRRQGYGTEAARGVMVWAGTHYRTSRFVASVSPANSASIALIARLGFVRIGQHVDEVDGIEHIFLRDVAASRAE
ncbi:MAG: GNAT family protein [Alphaproteobacteria bacterium]|nr:GNAT family protein [Alphaproteobacteria bacterium]